jgi:hypothetical protein
MSRYKEIKCEFRNLDSLKKALADCGIEHKIATNPKVPDLGMYGYHNDLRPERASILIDRHWVNDHWSGIASNDIGFAWNGSEFTAIVSDYDQSRKGVTEAMNKLRQRYSFHESMRLLHSKGYTVKSTTTENGQIRVTFAKR